MSYSINLNNATWNATKAIMDLDQSFVRTPDYLGVAYFWSHEFKHILRETTVAQRKRIHNLWLKQGLSFEAGIDPDIDTAPHWEVINRVLKKAGNK
tara:strand:- start:5728 stop:6015 length:288 start_codon:yes stop_codon:yes gene_type:complete